MKQKRIRNTLNKPCRVKLVTSRNRDVIIGPKPHQSTHFFYIPLRIHRWIFPGKAKHRRMLPNSNISRGEKLNHCRRFTVEKPFTSIFQIYITIISSPMLLIHFSCYFGKRRRCLPPGAYASLTSSVHVPLNTAFNQM